jgi:hypothetical protein
MVNSNLYCKVSRNLVRGLIIFVFSFSLKSCYTTRLSQLVIEHDNAKSSKRIKTEFYYQEALEKNSPLYSASQTIIKEIDSDNDITYSVYDILSIRSNSYLLEDTVYLIFGEEVIPVNIDYQKAENLTKTSENKQTITTYSSGVSSQKGSTKYEIRKNIKIKYKLSPEILVRICNSIVVDIRYYSGANMITIRLTGQDLWLLQKLIITT